MGCAQRLGLGGRKKDIAQQRILGCVRGEREADFKQKILLLSGREDKLHIEQEKHVLAHKSITGRCMKTQASYLRKKNCSPEHLFTIYCSFCCFSANFHKIMRLQSFHTAFTHVENQFSTQKTQKRDKIKPIKKKRKEKRRRCKSKSFSFSFVDGCYSLMPIGLGLCSLHVAAQYEPHVMLVK